MTIAKLTVNSGGWVSLSQADFAKRLRYVVDEVFKGVTDKAIAERADIHWTTLSRWKKADYKSGPPTQNDLRDLEPALGLPEGSLLGSAKEWEDVLKSLKVLADRGYGAVRIAPPGRLPTRVSESGEGAGWLWELPEQEAERQVRTTLRRVDETVRGLVGTPTTHGLQLDLIRVFEMQCEGQRRPIPDWLRMIRNEVIEGTFK